EPGPEAIDFIHNTFKEYLGAEKFAEEHITGLLVDKVSEPAWTPVVYFAAGCTDEHYANELLGAFIKKLETFRQGTRDQNEEGDNFKAIGHAIRGHLIKCYSLAISVNREQKEYVTKLKSDLLPPKDLVEAEMLASVGDELIDDFTIKNLPSRAIRPTAR